MIYNFYYREKENDLFHLGTVDTNPGKILSDTGGIIGRVLSGVNIKNNNDIESACLRGSYIFCVKDF